MTMRLQTYATIEFGQIYRITAIQQNVNYFADLLVLKAIPFGDWLAINLFGYVDDPEVVTYDFVNELNSVVAKERVKSNDLNGYLGVSIGQNIQ